MNNERLNLEQLIDLMKQGFRVEVMVLLNAGLFSRHELSLENNKVVDLSYVDGYETRYTLSKFIKQSIVAGAANRNNLILEQKWG